MTEQLQKDFDRFWAKYPKKKGKENCIKIFNRKKYDSGMVDIMIEKIEEYKKTKQWQDPQYIPFPSTWLNQGRFLDEIDPSEYALPAIEQKSDMEILQEMAKARTDKFKKNWGD